MPELLFEPAPATAPASAVPCPPELFVSVFASMRVDLAILASNTSMLSLVLEDLLTNSVGEQDRAVTYSESGL